MWRPILLETIHAIICIHSVARLNKTLRSVFRFFRYRLIVFKVGMDDDYCSAKNQINVSVTCVIISLTDGGRMTHICVGKLTIICSDNGLSPGRPQAITWTNAGISLIRYELLSEIITSLFKTKMHLKISSAKWRQFYLDLNMPTVYRIATLLVIRKASRVITFLW